MDEINYIQLQFYLLLVLSKINPILCKPIKTVVKPFNPLSYQLLRPEKVRKEACVPGGFPLNSCSCGDKMEGRSTTRPDHPTLLTMIQSSRCKQMREDTHRRFVCPICPGVFLPSLPARQPAQTFPLSFHSILVNVFPLPFPAALASPPRFAGPFVGWLDAQ